MKIGLSLAMNSANSDTRNSARKTHNDQWPRRLVLKFSQRRLLIGEIFIQRRRADVSGSVATSDLIPVRASTSDLSCLEVDTRVDPRVGQIGNQIHNDANQREYEKRGEDDGIVAVENAFEPQQAEAIERKNRFDQERTGEKGVHEGGWEASDNDQHGIPEYVAVEHLVAGAAFGPRREHILLADFLKKRVFGEQGHRRECRQRHGENRQRQMPKIVEDLLPPRKLPPTLRYQPAQRKPVKERAPGEKDDQQNGEEKPGDCVADDNDAGGPDVETGTIAHCFSDTKRNRDQVCQQRHPDPERHRYRQLLLDQLQYADIAEIALSEVKADVIPEHQPKALVGRLVEAELLFELLDEFGIETLRAPVLRARRVDLRGALRHAAAAEVASRRA